MRRIHDLKRAGLVMATAGAMGLGIGCTAHAGSITGSGLPIETEQPSLGLTYLILITHLAQPLEVWHKRGTQWPPGEKQDGPQHGAVPKRAQ